MTLRLDQHHWFFAGGVLVHNKGGHAHHSHGMGGVTRFRSRGDFSSMRTWAGFLLITSMRRRRYGLYLVDDEDKCGMADNATIQASCLGRIAPESHDFQDTSPPPVGFTPTNESCRATAKCCHQCMACETQACMTSIPSCPAFLAEVYTVCKSTEGAEIDDGGGGEGDGGIPIWASALGLIACGGACFAIAQMPSSETLAQRASRRHSMLTYKGLLPDELSLDGHYVEVRDKKGCNYTLNFQADGQFFGRSADDDGDAEVEGKVDMQRGVIMWLEQHSGATMEFDGRIVQQSSDEWVIRAGYVSSTGVRGRVEVFSKGRRGPRGAGYAPMEVE